MQRKKDFLIHFVGIKGVGMTALALLLKQAGFSVTGSDKPEVFITDTTLLKSGITPYTTFREEHVKQAKLVITTGAHGGFSNPEVVAAKANGIPVLTQGEAVGKCMSGTLLDNKAFRGISVTGTHGKTTTTAMLATLFTKLRLDPSYVIGTSTIASLPGPGHFGKGDYFIAEADEYVAEPTFDRTAKMLYQHPEVVVLTSIELDHPDVYEDLEAVKDVFAKFIAEIPTDGLLVACGDDENIRSILASATCRVRTYGFSPTNDFVITRVFISGAQTFFWVKANGTIIGEFHLSVPGEHNALNALACAVVGIEEGKDIDAIKKGLLSYTGSKRRLEKVGELPSGTLLYDDYAHHPTEIQKTLKTIRQMLPRMNITCVFQPHTYSRTRKLFDQFLYAFNDADTVILLDIYGSARELDTSSVSSLELSSALDKKHRNVIYCKDVLEAKDTLEKEHLTDSDVIVTMGAGDVYELHSLLRR